jgi:hypothetical protein
MPMEPPQPLDRRPVTEQVIAYRFVHVETVDDPPPVEDFLSDRDSGKRPLPREKAYPELRDGLSMYGSLEAARAVWRDVSEAAAARGQEVRLGNHVAEVVLTPGHGYDFEDLSEPDEHLTIWGDPASLAGAVDRIYPAETPSD